MIFTSNFQPYRDNFFIKICEHLKFAIINKELNQKIQFQNLKKNKDFFFNKNLILGPVDHAGNVIEKRTLKIN